MRTKNLYGINNKSNDVGVVRMYVTTCVTNKLQTFHNFLQILGKSVIPGTIGLFEMHGNLADIAIHE